MRKSHVLATVLAAILAAPVPGFAQEAAPPGVPAPAAPGPAWGGTASALPDPAGPAALPDGAEIDMGAFLGYSALTGTFLDRAEGAYAYRIGPVGISASFYVANDGKYLSQETWMAKAGGQYFMLGESYVDLGLGPLSFRGGWLTPEGSSGSDYDVFLNGGSRGAPGMVLSFGDDSFRYASRWIGIQSDSAQTYGYITGGATPAPAGTVKWRDKGANYRSMEFALGGGLTLGYEEVAVYLDRSFDPLYFLAPLPAILTNIVLSGAVANPMVVDLNDNSMMGLFLRYAGGEGPLRRAYAQLLIDDINLNFIFGDAGAFSAQNLSKLAWSLGAAFDTPLGLLGLHTAGATKHCYAATYAAGPDDPNTLPYEYVWYPAVSVGGRMIPIEENSMGLASGENSLAFKMALRSVAFPGAAYSFGLDASLEYVVGGARAPDDPWQGYNSCAEIPYRIELLDDAGPLEHKLRLSLAASRDFGDFGLKAKMLVGYVFNEVAEASFGGGDWGPTAYIPQAGADRFLFEFSLGGSWRIRF